jgi:biopolymer transport protein ExbD/biopolymer transport protein TolR
MDGSGGTGRAVSGINVTPLIDVLLVLLIIFMVIVPATPRGLDALIPQPPKSQATPPAVDPTILVQVLSNGAGDPIYKINETAFGKQEIEPELASIFATRQSKVVFVRGDADLDFSKVAEVIDIAHQANVDSVGLMSPRAAVER